MEVLLIVLSIGLFLLPIIVYWFRKSNIQNDVSSYNQKVEEEQKDMIQIMSKVIEDKSFNVWLEKESMQFVEMNISLVVGLQEDYKNLDQKVLIKLLKFAQFMIEENHQFPLFIISKTTGIIPSFNDEERINGTLFVTDIIKWKNITPSEIEN